MKNVIFILTFVRCLVDLLRHNDELNHLFKTFENYMQERERRCSTRTKSVKCSLVLTKFFVKLYLRRHYRVEMTTMSLR